MSRKVFNLTDRNSAELRQRGLVGSSIPVGDKMLAPGEMLEVDDDTFALAQPGLEDFVRLKALAVDVLPEDYAKEKAATKPRTPSTSDPADMPTDEPKAEEPKSSKKK